MLSVSIIIPIYNEIDYIEQFLNSLKTQSLNGLRVEFIFVDGGSTDGTTKVIDNFVNHELRAKLILNIKKITPISMNLGIKNSTGDIIVRMDVHASYPADYVLKLVQTLQETGADNVGAVLETIPGNKSNIAKIIAFAMSHPLGIGPSNFRTGSFTTQEVDTVPFGCYRRDVFDRIGYYDEDLVRSQDDELNGRLIKSGGKILLVHGLSVKYFGRKNFSQLWTMFFQYGYSKPLVNKKLKKAATIRQFAPPVFVMGVFISIFFLFIGLGSLSLIFWSVYILTLILITYKKLPICELSNVIKSFLTIHFSYGWGYLIGIFDFWIMGKTKISSKTKISR